MSSASCVFSNCTESTHINGTCNKLRKGSLSWGNYHLGHNKSECWILAYATDSFNYRCIYYYSVARKKLSGDHRTQANSDTLKSGFIFFLWCIFIDIAVGSNMEGSLQTLLSKSNLSYALLLAQAIPKNNKHTYCTLSPIGGVINAQCQISIAANF